MGVAGAVAVADVPTASVQITMGDLLAFDSFTRVEVNGWGNAPSGQLWNIAGGVNADYSVNGTQGLHRHTIINTSHRTDLAVGTAVDMDVQFDIAGTPLATGTGGFEFDNLARFTDASNFYTAKLVMAVGGVVTLQLFAVVAGTTSTLTTSLVLPQAHLAADTWTVRFRVCGPSLMAKAWRSSSTTEPGWSVTTTSPHLTTGSRAGMRSLVQTGNTNALPLSFAFDNFTATDPFTTLWRVTPDGVRSLVRGSPFTFSANNAILYDTEAPLNTSVFYQLQACTDVVSSNSVVIESGPDGWLKDPLRPYRDVKLDNCSVHSPQCLSTDANVFFQYLAPETYPSASGVFPIVDNARPNVVGQTRKDQQSTLGIVSRKLADVTRIRQLLSPGTQLLLQLPSKYGWGIETWGSDYAQVYDDGAQRLGTDMGKPYRLWALPFTAANAPADVNSGGSGGGTIGVPGTMYRDSTATGRTYAQSTALGRTYLVRSQHPTF